MKELILLCDIDIFAFIDIGVKEADVEGESQSPQYDTRWIESEGERQDDYLYWPDRSVVDI